MADRGNEVVAAQVIAETERPVDRNAAYLENLQDWAEKASSRLRGIAKADAKRSRGEKMDERSVSVLRQSSAEFQIDYARRILSLPDRAENEDALRKILLSMTMPEDPTERNMAERLIKGSVSMVTFVELLHSMGPEYQQLKIEDMAVDWETDVHGGIDFAVSVGGKVFAISLKTTRWIQVADDSIIQRVNGDKPVGDSYIRLEVEDQRRMLKYTDRWRQQMERLNDDREIVSLLVMVPMDSQAMPYIDRRTGFFLDMPQYSYQIDSWKEAFAKRMKEEGFVIENVGGSENV